LPQQTWRRAQDGFLGRPAGVWAFGIESQETDRVGPCDPIWSIFSQGRRRRDAGNDV